MRTTSLIAAAVMVLMPACNPFAPDQTVELGVRELNAPSTTPANVPLDVTLVVELGGCLSFDRIQVQRSGAEATLTVLGKDSSIGRKNVACTSDIRYESHIVRFDPPFSGTFDITVNRGRISPLRATVQVQ